MLAVLGVGRPNVLLAPTGFLLHVAVAGVPEAVRGAHPCRPGAWLVAVDVAAAVAARSAEGAKAAGAAIAASAIRILVQTDASAGPRRSQVPSLLARGPPQLALVGVRLSAGVAHGLEALGAVAGADAHAALAAGAQLAAHAPADVAGSPGRDRDGPLVAARGPPKLALVGVRQAVRPAHGVIHGRRARRRAAAPRALTDPVEGALATVARVRAESRVGHSHGR